MSASIYNPLPVTDVTFRSDNKSLTTVRASTATSMVKRSQGADAMNPLTIKVHFRGISTETKQVLSELAGW